MSDSTTNTTVNLLVNGQQAEETLANLRKRAADLQAEIAKAAAAGDKVQLKKLRKEFNDVNRQIKQIESSTQQAENVLRRLDRATPQELNKALVALTKQLNYIERGSVAWDEQTKKIRMVKDEIARMNKEMQRSSTLVERFNAAFQKWQTIGAGVIGAVTGLTLAGRKAVNNFAEMDEQLANTRKYTGMTVEQVQELNDAFKKMSTRTARDQLNLLAQEAGRLGKTTLEDVQGYVEAADIINVALVDLGQGATQVIAKLSNIFGVEEALGTRDAMLAVGSAVNVLSQNCTADKKYLVEFAQRMAGIGSVSKMTIPEILAFGATLDANGQKCEMSASSLGKLIMKLYQEPAEMARQVGLDVENFTATMQRSTNEGVLMFMQRIKEMGSKDGLAVLAPMFKELGVDGVRMSQVMATLADKLDMVRWEQEEANKAFAEATSATNEYIIFNNTAQAGIDKARKRFQELTIEIGEKLLPVMRHVLTTSSMTMRGLNLLVDFVIKYHKELIALTASIVAYQVAVNLAIIKEKLHAALIAVKTAALHVHRVAVLAASVAYNRLTGNVVRANAAMKLLRATMMTNPWGLLAAAVTAVIAALVIYVKRQKEATKELTMQEQIQKRLADVEKKAKKSYEEQATEIATLNEVVHNSALSLDTRRKALEKLQQLVPDYHAALTKEGQLINDNTDAIDKYLAKLEEKVKFQAFEEELTAALKEKVEAEKAIITAQQAIADAAEYKSDIQDNPFEEDMKKQAQAIADIADAASRAQLEKAEETIRKITEMMNKMKVKPISLVTDDNTGVPTGGDDDKKTGKTNKFQAEDDWREREQALNRIAYAKGETDYEAYTKRMLEIEVDYNKKKLEHTDLVGNEQVTIEAAYYEALKKQQDNFLKGTVEEENKRYNEELIILQQRYVDGEMTARQYQNAIELAELQHLQNLVKLYKEGSKERLKAQQNYHKTSLKYQEKHLQEDKKLQEQLQSQFFTKQFHIADPDSYQRDLRNLDIVYNQMLKATEGNAKERLKVEKAYHEAKYQLARKYNMKEAADTENKFRSAIDNSVEWLQSDGGQAMVQTFDMLVSQMSQIFSSLSDIVQAELDIQTAQIENRYAQATSDAEGNKYREVQLEKQKQKEIAKAKKDANRKMFAMQVIQAVAQTAQAAISAYSSAAAIPVVGWIMAPIAAGLAIAAGALQIAAIKKQQQASEATGYQEGGFTKKGRKDEVAGVVHAGEWVASQELVNNPNTRPLINALDYAQRTNTLANLRAEDVSRTITAPAVIAERLSSQGAIASNIRHSSVQTAKADRTETDNSLADTLARLNQRLQEPFVTVNTVSGDAGIKKAQDEYEQLMKNKTPKSRR